jgi:hypothetical protein
MISQASKNGYQSHTGKEEYRNQAQKKQVRHILSTALYAQVSRQFLIEIIYPENLNVKIVGW